MKLLFILVCFLHLVGGRCKVIKNGFECDASDKRFLDNVVNEKRNLLSRRPEIAETGAGFCTSLLFLHINKEQVRQCFGFCTADFRSWLVYESAVQKPSYLLAWQKPKHCPTLLFALLAHCLV